MLSPPSTEPLGGGNAVERLARLGYGARGAVYVAVGGLALLAALGRGGQAGDSEDALRAVLAGPFGAVVVGLIALGLLGFSLWRFVEAVTDADGRGTSAKGLAVRGAHLVSAGIYLGLSASAAGLSLGLGSGGGAHDWTAWLLDRPSGRWLAGLAGLAVAGGGLGFLGKAAGGDVAARLALDEAARRWAEPLGRCGYAARGVAFVIVGGLVVAAAWQQRQAEAKGLAEAFALLRAQPYGWALLGLAGAGHAAFGLFGLIQARYRRIDAPDVDRLDDAAGEAARALT